MGEIKSRVLEVSGLRDRTHWALIRANPPEKKQLVPVMGEKVAVDYGFPWDTNTSLLGRSPGFSSLATTPPSILRRTPWLLIQHCCFGLEDHPHNKFHTNSSALLFPMISYEQ